MKIDSATMEVLLRPMQTCMASMVCRAISLCLTEQQSLPVWPPSLITFAFNSNANSYTCNESEQGWHSRVMSLRSDLAERSALNAGEEPVCEVKDKVFARSDGILKWEGG